MATGIFRIEGDFHKEESDEDDYEISDDVSFSFKTFVFDIVKLKYNSRSSLKFLFQ